MTANDRNKWDALLEGIEKPGRYVGGEFNAYRKDFAAADVHFVLAFPDVYEVGLSHLGLRLLYHLLNGMDGVMADRAYAPWLDFEAQLRRMGEPLRGIESRRPLSAFDFVGVSLQYELSYSNIFTLLDLGGVALSAGERGAGDPWVIAGGPCAYNPEPLAEVFDFLVLGEAEQVLPELISVYRDWRAGGGGRRDYLEAVRHIGGVYVPSFFRVRYHGSGPIAAIEPVYADYPSVSKRLVMNLDEVSPIPRRPLVPLVDIVHNRLGLEIARGCTRGCRFCQAGYVYRPVRERDPAIVLDRAEAALGSSGFEELSLLSLSSGDYCQVEPLLRALMNRYAADNVAVALPSMRVGTLTPELMTLIRKVRKTGFTLAPEAGSERLRRVINKGISDQDLLATATEAFKQGWRVLKLYFMAGLPTETAADLDALVDLCMQVWQRAKPSRAAINVAVSTYVPKPLTPFQWVGQLPPDEIRKRLAGLHERLRRPGLRFKWHDPGQSLMEAVFARGDRRLGRALLEAWRDGARFDGWTEQFDLDRWRRACAKAGVDLEFYAGREREAAEVLPWDHLSAGIDKQVLWQEYQLGLDERFTEDCRWGACSRCGVCDHREVKPVLFREPTPAGPEPAPPSSAAAPAGASRLYRVLYAKRDDARYLGQIELSRALERALRRARLPVEYSGGFHPHVKISFTEALPLGMESEVEELYLSFSEAIPADQLGARLQPHLPQGIEINSVEPVDRRLPRARELLVCYRVSGLTASQVQAIVSNYPSRMDQSIGKKTKRGQVTLPLREVLKRIDLLADGALTVQLVEQDNIRFRPRPVLEWLLGDSAEGLIGCRIVKTSVTLPEGD